MKMTVQKIDASLSGETMVIFAGQKSIAQEKKGAGAKKNPSKKSEPNIEILASELSSPLKKIAQEASFSADLGDGLFLRGINLGGYKNVALMGLGNRRDWAEGVRQAAGSTQRFLVGHKIKEAAVFVPTISEDIPAEALGRVLTEGFELANYCSDLYKAKRQPGMDSVVFLVSQKQNEFSKGMKEGQILAECTNFSRTLGDRPANLMTPTILGEEITKAATGTRLKVSVWNRDKIKKEKMGSFLGVSLGSSQEPKFIVAEYNGASPSQKPICFVGKAVTFDSGGISIKPGAGMEEMKFDMCGGANVLGAVLAMARLGLKVNAKAFVPATENMPGPGANKPGDVVIARNGVSIEVNNTDAEGRLILADALVYACEQKPRFIVDAATLTGAMVIALGSTHTGFYSRHPELCDKVREAADRSGERVWQMPLTEDHLKDMKGTYADLSNISSSKGAGSATAAAFLSQFVEPDIPWVHFDIAGTAWHNGNRLSYCNKKGASGLIVRTFVEMARGAQS